jgi:hypothetical protein
VSLDKSDTCLAELWRTQVLRQIEAQLIAKKSVLFGLPDSEIETAGESIRRLTALEALYKYMHGSELVRKFREQAGSNPVGTRRMVLDATEDEADAQRWAGVILRLLVSSVVASEERSA